MVCLSICLFVMKCIVAKQYKVSELGMSPMNTILLFYNFQLIHLE